MAKIDFIDDVKNALCEGSLSAPIDAKCGASLARIAHPPQGYFENREIPEPAAGGLFAVRDLGVRELAEPRFGGWKFERWTNGGRI